MQEPTPPVLSPKKFVFSWRRLLLHCSIISLGLILGLLSWYISKPQTTRLYETDSEQSIAIAAAPNINIALDINSSIAVTNSHPAQIELLKGNAYFVTSGDSSGSLEVRVRAAFIRDLGTRFSIRMQKDGSSNIAVAEGQIEIHVASGAYLVSAREQVDFDGFRITNHRLTDNNIAPWHTDE